MEATTPEERITRTITSCFEAARTKDREAWVSSFAENAVVFDPVAGPPIEGHEGLRAFFDRVIAAFDRVELAEEDVFVAEDGAAVKWTGRGIARDGNVISFEGIDVFEVDDDGRIRTLWAYWDPEEVLARLAM